MLLLMTLAADHLEAGGEAAGSRALAEFTRKSQIPAWLSSADGKPVGGQGPPEGQKALVNRAVRLVGVEPTPIESDLLLARPVRSATGRLYVVAFRVPLLLPISMVPVRSLGVQLMLVIVVAGVVCWRLTRRFLLLSQQRFLTDISHELRSPLARLSLALELAKRKIGDGIVEHARVEREIDSATDHPWALAGARSVYQYSAGGRLRSGARSG